MARREVLREREREDKEERDLQEEFRTDKREIFALCNKRLARYLRSITRAKCMLANLAQIVLSFSIR